MKRDHSASHRSCGWLSSFLICLSGLTDTLVLEFRRFLFFFCFPSWIFPSCLGGCQQLWIWCLLPSCFRVGCLCRQPSAPPWRLNLMMIGCMSGLRGSPPPAALRLRCVSLSAQRPLWLPASLREVFIHLPNHSCNHLPINYNTQPGLNYNCFAECNWAAHTGLFQRIS